MTEDVRPYVIRTYDRWIILVIVLVVGVILIIGGLTFFPALALGPIVEHLAMNANTLF